MQEYGVVSVLFEVGTAACEHQPLVDHEGS